MAAASLLVDYTLTVSVSISAGVLAITSAFPELDAHRVAMCLLFLAILTLGNLRGIRESGRIFAVPRISSSSASSLLIAAGLYRYLTGASCRSIAAPRERRHPAADDIPAADGIRQRLHRDDRRRGGVERRAGIPPARVEERGGHAPDDGGAGDRDVPGITVLAHGTG